MKKLYRSLSALVGAVALTILLVPNANAICGVNRPTPTHTGYNYQPGGAHFLLANDVLDNFSPIVGMWHVKFFLKDTAGFKDGTEFDAGYSIWHGDGTEIMQSGGRPPLIGDMCMGVWKQVGLNVFKLNHFAAAYDNTGLNLIGPAQIQEQITLERAGNSFSGPFTIDQYTEAGNRVAHFQGTITGTRMTVETPATSIF
ncbi:hypothetical protein RBB77_09385 [Tunturibacter psychrotolerans]|uniref:Uncharacterized protein n=1 Tax=Tunturiibacter psychrotolerans TaxID=3069686 RepID=A0AAU7ZVX7_9BACT